MTTHTFGDRRGGSIYPDRSKLARGIVSTARIPSGEQRRWADSTNQNMEYLLRKVAMIPEPDPKKPFNPENILRREPRRKRPGYPLQAFTTTLDAIGEWLINYGETAPQTKTFDITNSGEANSVLNWELSIDVGSGISDAISLDKTSGSLIYGESETVTITLDPTLLPVEEATYTVSLSLKDSVCPAVDSGSFTVTVFLLDPPALNATAGKECNYLSWNEIDNAATYKIYVSYDNFQTEAELVSTEDLTYTHAGAWICTNHFYQITAVNAFGYESRRSGTAYAMPIPYQPGFTLGTIDDFTFIAGVYKSVTNQFSVANSGVDAEAGSTLRWAGQEGFNTPAILAGCIGFGPVSGELAFSASENVGVTVAGTLATPGSYKAQINLSALKDCSNTISAERTFNVIVLDQVPTSCPWSGWPVGPPTPPSFTYAGGITGILYVAPHGSFSISGLIGLDPQDCTWRGYSADTFFMLKVQLGPDATSPSGYAWYAGAYGNYNQFGVGYKKHSGLTPAGTYDIFDGGSPDWGSSIVIGAAP